jgi:hypothetical protein
LLRDNKKPCAGGRPRKAADVNGDGDTDICTQPWNGSLHFYLRDMSVDDRQKRVK